MKTPQTVQQIAELGLSGAVANKHARKTILAHLNANAVPWWKPDLYWAIHRELLHELKPAEVEIF